MDEVSVYKLLVKRSEIELFFKRTITGNKKSSRKTIMFDKYRGRICKIFPNADNARIDAKECDVLYLVGLERN